MDELEIPARTSPTCRHGRSGYCADDALEEERRAMEFVYQHAYDWAIAQGIDRDTAEGYAAWSARKSWTPGTVYIGGSHPRDFNSFQRARKAG